MPSFTRSRAPGRSEAGLRFIVFTDDHDPAHVHVVGDGTAKVDLAGPGGKPELIRNDRLKAGDLRKTMRIVEERQAAMLERWNAIHG